MLKRYIPFVILAALLACSKNKLETKPSIKITNINSQDIYPGETATIKLEYNDKEGDISNGELTYVRNRTNTFPISNPIANDKADTARYPLPEFPKTPTGEIVVSIPYDFMTEDPNVNDTMFFRIMVIDAAGNKSDTLTTGQFIAHEN